MLLHSTCSSGSSSPLVSPAGGVCVLRVPRGAVPLAPPKPGAGTAALQRGAALGRHGDPAVPVAAQEGPAAPQVHQDRSAVSPATDPVVTSLVFTCPADCCCCVAAVSSSRTCCPSSLWFWVWTTRLSADCDSPGRYDTLTVS